MNIRTYVQWYVRASIAFDALDEVLSRDWASQIVGCFVANLFIVCKSSFSTFFSVVYQSRLGSQTYTYERVK